MKRVEPHLTDTTGAGGGDFVGFNPATGAADWMPGVLLIENGASVPAGTAVGTLIFEKA